MRLLLLRKIREADGVFGEMTLIEDDDRRTSPHPPRPDIWTVEDDWRDNAPRISCIPSGLYALHRTIYIKHGYETFEVLKVPGRTRILIHPANTEEDLEGCIGVGLRMGKIRVVKDEDTGELDRVKDGVVESRVAFSRFMEAMAHVDEATLEIQWVGDIAPTPAVAP